MSETDSIEAATRRLALALDALDAAAERRREAARHGEALATQIHVLGDDRARLAGELDQAIARSHTLETANREVAKRIVAAIETIRSVLGNEDGSGDEDDEDESDDDEEEDEDEPDDEEEEDEPDDDEEDGDEEDESDDDEEEEDEE
jgi:hypothetical protein